MKGGTTRAKRRLSPAEWAGFFACTLYLPLLLLGPLPAMVPLALFIGSCCVLPFCPTSCFFLPVISRGKTGKNVVGLTFDDGPSPASTPLLLQLLARHKVSATFFVTGERAAKYPDILRAILAGGHAVGNHSYSHDDLIMFRSVERLVGEIENTQRVFEEFGFQARFFRPPVGILTSRYAEALHRTGLQTVNFSRRARDMGNRRVRGLAARILGGLQSDDIILLHDVLPRKQSDPSLWLAEVEAIIQGVRMRGLDFVSLDVLTGQSALQWIDRSKR